MYRRTALVACFSALITSACDRVGQASSRPSFGVVVRYEGVPGSILKYGVEAISETGMHLFSPSGIEAPTQLAGSGGTSSYAGAGLPSWVRVTWRKPIRGQIVSTTGKLVETLDFGEIIGDYKIEVASRIPLDVQQYASQGKGRAIRLYFRLHDEGVLLAWDVQELRPGDGIWTYSMPGGDFRTTKFVKGVIAEKGWYIHPKTGQKIETEF